MGFTWFVFTISFALLLYIYGGFYGILRVAVFTTQFGRSKQNSEGLSKAFQKDDLPGVSICLPVLNEAETIIKRLENLYESDYEKEKIEVIVISDGSSDNTVAVVQEYRDKNPDKNIQVIELATNQGRASAHNLAAKQASFGILIATDAETVFESNTLKELAAPFLDDNIGVVGGVIEYRFEKGSGVGEGYNKYRELERKTRQLQTYLRLLPKTDGPCTAYRKEIWQDLEGFEDVDHVITIFARKKGMIAIQAENARCYDKANVTGRQDLKQRSRMARKTLLSTFNRWKAEDWLKYPLFGLMLFSHRIVRLFSPIFLLLLLISSVWLFIAHFGVISLFIVSLCILSLGGVLYFLRPKLWSKAQRLARAFLIAQLGFARGLLGWLLGNKSGTYMPTRQLKT